VKIKSFKSFREGNIKPIWESKNMLDISIQYANKYLTTDKKKEEFLNRSLIIEEKLDGVKITLLKINNTGIAEQDWIMSYKNNIILPDEFDFLPLSHIKNKSIGAGQFSKFWDHLKKLRKTNIPIGTEIFCEALIRKPTLSSKYTKLHELILIGYSKSSYEIKGSKLLTKPKGFFTNKRNEYAKELKINVPPLLFEGTLSPKTEFLKGIKDPELLSLYRERSDQINWDNNDAIIENIFQMFLDRSSNYGGKPEGVVIKYKNANTILKVNQPYQTDQKEREKIKQQFKGTIEEENEYWKNVYDVVGDILKIADKTDLHKALKEVSKYLKSYTPNFNHPVKNNDMIKEDIQLSAKMMISKRLPGNNGALILGKFRVFTIAHFNMIKEASAKYDSVTVAVISGKDTKGTKNLRNKIIEDCLSQFGNIEIINASTGNLTTLLNKSRNNINTVIAGSDRVQDYENQLKKSKGISIYEVKRSEFDISATKVIANLENYEYFKKNTPQCSHKYYDEYLKIYR